MATRPTTPVWQSGHALAANCAGLWSPAAVGTAVNYADGTRDGVMGTDGGTTGISEATNAFGACVDFDFASVLGFQDYWNLEQSIDVSADSDVTFMFAGKMSTAAQAKFWRRDSSGSPTGDTFNLCDSSARPNIRWSGTNILAPGSGTAIGTDETVIIYIVRSETDYEVWIDGVEEYGDTHAVATPAFSIDYMLAGYNSLPSVDGFDGQVNAMGLWTSALSSADVATLTADPFVLIRASAGSVMPALSAILLGGSC